MGPRGARSQSAVPSIEQLAPHCRTVRINVHYLQSCQGDPRLIYSSGIVQLKIRGVWTVMWPRSWNLKFVGPISACLTSHLPCRLECVVFSHDNHQLFGRIQGDQGSPLMYYYNTTGSKDMTPRLYVIPKYGTTEQPLEPRRYKPSRWSSTVIEFYSIFRCFPSTATTSASKQAGENSCWW